MMSSFENGHYNHEIQPAASSVSLVPSTPADGHFCEAKSKISIVIPLRPASLAPCGTKCRSKRRYLRPTVPTKNIE